MFHIYDNLYMHTILCWHANCSCILNVLQVVKILSLYTPQSDLEERVMLNFIRTVQVRAKASSSKTILEQGFVQQW